MKLKFYDWFTGLASRPVAIINIIGLLIIVVGLLYFVFVPIDVLKGWRVETTLKAQDGKLPVYYPAGTLEFKSKSTKLMSADGITTRIFDCDAVGNAPAREIQLDAVPANRPPGYNSPKENSIVVPNVNQFNGLPRTCRLVFNICYNNVILWRDHCESAKTNDFTVAEEELDAATIRKQLEELRIKYQELESKLGSIEATSDVATTPQPISSTPQESPESDQVATAEPRHQPTTRSNDTGKQPTVIGPRSDDGFQLHDLPLVGEALMRLGL